jgi:cytochrome b subunit of formate dehydrogenase
MLSSFLIFKITGIELAAGHFNITTQMLSVNPQDY